MRCEREATMTEYAVIRKDDNVVRLTRYNNCCEEEGERERGKVIDV